MSTLRPSSLPAVEASDADSVIHADQPVIRAPLPANVTYRDLIAANKRKSVLLMIGMSMLLVLIGGVFAGAFMAWQGATDARTLLPSIALGATAAGVFAAAASAWSFYGGSSAILSMAGAKEMPREADPQLHNVVEELAIAAGVPKPRIFLIDDAALNAFATGRDPEHAALAITKGLREQLTRDELAGVMAHELSHVRHYDIRFAMLMATTVGLIVFACDAFWRILRYHAWTGNVVTVDRSGRASRGRSEGGDNSGAMIYLVIVILALALAVIAPMLAMVIRLAVSRQREYLADAGAVELTRYPQGMIGALQKLGASRVPLASANRATEHLYIVEPSPAPLHGEDGGHNFDSLFRTHPPLRDRIARLQALIT